MYISNIKIIDKDDNEIALCYLIFLLHSKKYLKLNYDSNYQEYLEQNFRPFTNKGANGQFKNNIRKVQRNIKLKKSIGKPLELFIETLSLRA